MPDATETTNEQKPKPKFDPEKTAAIPVGSLVTHFGKQIHYDGAKDTEEILEIVGEGPATATPAEEK